MPLPDIEIRVVADMEKKMPDVRATSELNKFTKLVKDLNRIGDVTTELAEQILLVRTKMTGRGINPAEAPVVEARLLEIETKLRQIGSNPSNLIPFLG